LLLISPIISQAIRAANEDEIDAAADTRVVDSVTVGEDTDNPLTLVYTMTIDGAIGAVTSDRIEDALDKADEDGAALLVIFMDTPGGFTKPTWTICKNILNSPVPVCTYIAPSGARAGSAGVYITYASHFAAMAPSTNIGAAHPVGGGGQEVDSVMNEKITNDAVAQIKAAAEKRGRNAEWAERAVRESVSITDNEALAMGVIEFRAEDIEDLLRQINGREADLPGGKKTMKLDKTHTEEIPTSWIYRLLELITDPDIALILFSLGSLGLMLELYNPGAILPGVVGAISLLLALYAFQTLPINYTGVALILLAIILFIAEIKVVSHGILTIGGVIAFFLGGLMLVDSVDPALRVSMTTLITVTIVVGVAFAVVIWLVIKAHGRKVVVGNEGMIGQLAEVRRPDMVHIEGALWKARTEDRQALTPGDTVEVVAVQGLTLIVRKTNS